MQDKVAMEVGREWEREPKIDFEEVGSEWW